tara:strand:+ start:18332 stop:19171 length:840 start_codon:yes stop_codon:yes gene_type:complete
MANEIGGRGPLILFIIVVVLILAFLVYLAYVYVDPAVSSRSNLGCIAAGAPSNLTAVNFQLTKIRLTWPSTPNATRYRVYIGSISGFNIATSFQDFVTNSTEAVVDDLVIGREYFFRVQSINACNSTSGLSVEASATLGYPAKFRIKSKTDPSKSLRVALNFEDAELSTDCSGLLADDSCIWTYDELTGEIRPFSTPSNCLKTFPTLVDTGAKVDICEDPLLLNNQTAKTWNYTPDTGTLCNPINSMGLNCLKVQQNGTDVIRIPFDNTVSMSWDIVGV